MAKKVRPPKPIALVPKGTEQPARDILRGVRSDTSAQLKGQVEQHAKAKGWEVMWFRWHKGAGPIVTPAQRNHVERRAAQRGWRVGWGR